MIDPYINLQNQRGNDRIKINKCFVFLNLWIGASMKEKFTKCECVNATIVKEIYERCMCIRSASKSESQAWQCDMLHGTHNTRITTTSIRHALQHSVGVIFQGLPPFAFFHNSHQPISRFCINCHVLLSLYLLDWWTLTPLLCCLFNLEKISNEKECKKRVSHINRKNKYLFSFI